MVVVFLTHVSYIICDIYDCTHNRDEPPKECNSIVYLGSLAMREAGKGCQECEKLP